VITITWGTFAAVCLFVATVGPGFYLMGRMSKQVDVNTGNIGILFTKIDVIHEYVKNGGARK
jgi:hypothetical protein